MRHLNFPKPQPTYNPQEWTGVDPRYSHRLEVPTTAPIEARANQAQARLAADLLSLRKNFTITLEAGKANYRTPYTLKEIVRARMTRRVPAGCASPRGGQENGGARCSFRVSGMR